MTLIDAIKATGADALSDNARDWDVTDLMGEVRDDNGDYVVRNGAIYAVKADGVVESVPAYRPCVVVA